MKATSFLSQLKMKSKIIFLGLMLSSIVHHSKPNLDETNENVLLNDVQGLTKSADLLVTPGSGSIRLFGQTFWLDSRPINDKHDAVTPNDVANSASKDKGILAMPHREEEMENIKFNEFQTSRCDLDTLQPLCSQVDHDPLAAIALASPGDSQILANMNNEENNSILPVLGKWLEVQLGRSDVMADHTFTYAYAVRKVINSIINHRVELEITIEANQRVIRPTICGYKKQINNGKEYFRLVQMLKKINFTEDQLSKKPDEMFEVEDFLELAMEYNLMKCTWYKLRALYLGNPYPDCATKDLKEYQKAAEIANQLFLKHDALYMRYAENLEKYRHRFGIGIKEVEHQQPNTSNVWHKIQSKADIRKGTLSLRKAIQRIKTKRMDREINTDMAYNYAADLKSRETWVPTLIRYTARHLSELPDRHPRSGEFLEFACTYHQHQIVWYKTRANKLEEFCDSRKNEHFESRKYKVIIDRARKYVENHEFLLGEYESAFEKFLLAMAKSSAIVIPHAKYIQANEAALLKSINHFLKNNAKKKRLLETSSELSSVRQGPNSLSHAGLQELSTLPLKAIGMTTEYFEVNTAVRPIVRVAYYTAVYEEAKWRASKALLLLRESEQLDRETKESLLAGLYNVMRFMEHQLKKRAQYQEPPRTIEPRLALHLNSVGKEGELRRFKNAVFQHVLTASISVNPTLEKTMSVLSQNLRNLARLEEVAKLPRPDILNHDLTPDLPHDFLQLAVTYHSMLIKVLHCHKSNSETLKTSKDLTDMFKWMPDHERAYEELSKLLKKHMDLAEKGISAIRKQTTRSLGEQSGVGSTEVYDRDKFQPHGFRTDSDVALGSVNDASKKRTPEDIGGSGLSVHAGDTSGYHEVGSDNKKVKYS